MTPREEVGLLHTAALKLGDVLDMYFKDSQEPAVKNSRELVNDINDTWIHTFSESCESVAPIHVSNAAIVTRENFVHLTWAVSRLLNNLGGKRIFE